MHDTLYTTGAISAALAFMLAACGSPEATAPAPEAATPAPKAAAVKTLPSEVFDLSHWNITVPTDVNEDGKVDVVKIKDIQSYSHSDFFYVNNDGHVVLQSAHNGELIQYAQRASLYEPRQRYEY